MPGTQGCAYNLKSLIQTSVSLLPTVGLSSINQRLGWLSWTKTTDPCSRWVMMAFYNIKLRKFQVLAVYGCFVRMCVLILSGGSCSLVRWTYIGSDAMSTNGAGFAHANPQR